MEFKREHYLNALIRKQHNHLIKTVTGMRRVGKSYLIFTLFKKHLLSQGIKPSHIIEMSFDTFENLRYRDPNEFYPYVKNLIKDDGMHYVLLDEIQLLGDFESVLNGLLRLENVDLYVTGSNAKFLSKDVITEFRGRGDEIYVSPLNFSEFMSEYGGSSYDGYKEYILYGGLPPVVLLRTSEEKISFLKSLFEETYIKDVMSRNNLVDKGTIDDLLNFLSSSIGSLTNPTKLSNTFKGVKHKNVSDKTISKYIDCLCDAFLISRAERYNVKGRGYIGSPYKYYFSDIGLRNARINFRQLEETHTMENIIYNELVCRGYNVDVGVIPIIEREVGSGSSKRKQLEIDFVCNKGSARYYIQSALAVNEKETLEQEIRPFNHVADSFRKIIIVKDTPAPRYTDEGVLVMSVYDFLLNRDSLDLKAI